MQVKTIDELCGQPEGSFLKFVQESKKANMHIPRPKFIVGDLVGEDSDNYLTVAKVDYMEYDHNKREWRYVVLGAKRSESNLINFNYLKDRSNQESIILGSSSTSTKSFKYDYEPYFGIYNDEVRRKKIEDYAATHNYRILPEGETLEKSDCSVGITHGHVVIFTTTCAGRKVGNLLNYPYLRRI